MSIKKIGGVVGLIAVLAVFGFVAFFNNSGRAAATNTHYGCGNITGFTLVNAETSQDIMSLSNGTIVQQDLSKTKLTIRANTSQTVGSVKFILGHHSKVENYVPYGLYGDSNGNYAGHYFQSGSYTLTAKSFYGPNASGQKCDFKTITFQIAEKQQPDPVELSKISGNIYADLNSNGVKDGSEYGLDGGQVNLVDANMNIVNSVWTDSNGDYSFHDIPAGQYQVVVPNPPTSLGLFPTVDADGVDTANVIIASKTGTGDILGQDFGYGPDAPEPTTEPTQPPSGLSKISGLIFADLNGNGVQDAGEYGLEGGAVTLRDLNDGVLDTVWTDSNGNYEFMNVPAGEYQIVIKNPPTSLGLFPTVDADGVNTPNVIVVTKVGGNDVTGQDFGYGPDAPEPTPEPTTEPTPEPTEPPSGLSKIGGRVFADLNRNGVQDAGEAGLDGGAITLRDLNDGVIDVVYTDGNGDYEFINVPAGEYQIVIKNPPTSFGLFPTADADGIATPNVIVVTKVGGNDVTGQDFGYGPEAPEPTPVPTVLPTIVPTVVPTIEPTPVPTIAPTPIPTSEIDGTIWLDADRDTFQNNGEGGIAGVTVNLVDAAGNIVSTSVTDGNGRFVFPELLEGSYNITVDPTTLPADLTSTFDTDGNASENVINIFKQGGNDVGNLEFGYGPIPAPDTSKVSGILWNDDNQNGVIDADEAILSGVTVNLKDSDGNIVDITVTDANGMYMLSGIEAGSYTVQVDPANIPAGLDAVYDVDGIGTLNEITVTKTGTSDIVDQNFGYADLTPPTSKVSGIVWNDANQNGVLDNDESPISGVNVSLLINNVASIGSTVTDENGMYMFSDVPEGILTVKINPTDAELAGLDPVYDSDGVASPNQIIVAKTGGVDIQNQDFGYTDTTPEPLTSSVAGQLFIDNDGDGVFSDGDTPLSGIDVALVATDANGTVIDTVTTDANGNYIIDGIAPGTYFVSVVKSTLPDGLVPVVEFIQFQKTGTDPVTGVDFSYTQTNEVPE